LSAEPMEWEVVWRMEDDEVATLVNLARVGGSGILSFAVWLGNKVGFLRMGRHGAVEVSVLLRLMFILVKTFRQSSSSFKIKSYFNMSRIHLNTKPSKATHPAKPASMQPFKLKPQTAAPPHSAAHPANYSPAPSAHYSRPPPCTPTATACCSSRRKSTRPGPQKPG